MSLWIDGTPAAGLPERLFYGDGVFRTCLIYGSQVFDLADHIAKLRQDADRLSLDCESAAVEGDAKLAARGQKRGVLRLCLVRRDAGRGYRSASRSAHRIAEVHPAPAFPRDAWAAGVATFRSPVRLACQPLLAGIKHLNRLEQVLAGFSWVADAHEGLMSDADGRPVCGTRANLFWIRGRTLYTPRLDRCGVAGLMRDRVLQLAAAENLQAEFVAAEWGDVLSAEEVFLTNSLIGIWPVRTIDDVALKAPGPITQTLLAALAHPGVA